MCICALTYMWPQDDIPLGRPVPQSFFFSDGGKPHVGRRGPTWGCIERCGAPHRLYVQPSVVSFPTPPSTAPSAHWWYPMLKSVAFDLEKRYPQYFAFAASHREGRFSSSHNSDSSPAAKAENSQEECWCGSVCLCAGRC